MTRMTSPASASTSTTTSWIASDQTFLHPHIRPADSRHTASRSAARSCEFLTRRCRLRDGDLEGVDRYGPRFRAHAARPDSSVANRMEGSLGITGPQRLLLRVVSQRPGLSPGEVARMVHLHPSTMTAILQRLVKKGLLRRDRDNNDHRRIRLHTQAAARDCSSPGQPAPSNRLSPRAGASTGLPCTPRPRSAFGDCQRARRRWRPPCEDRPSKKAST